MIHLVIGIAVLAVATQTGAQEEKPKPKLPPFRVVITAKSQGVPERERLAFEKELKQLKGYAEQISRIPVPNDPEMYEEWTFEIPGEAKFDPTPLWRAFINIKCRKYHLTLTGTLSQEAQTKKLFITSYSEKTKVKLMNKPKDVFDKEGKSEDKVAKLTERMTVDGKVHFTVKGEIFSHGGTLALLLESFEAAKPPPPKPKEEKK